MAAGVQQAGNGATLTFEDHSNGEAGGDSAYSLAELEAQVVAKGFKQADGVTPTIVKQVGTVTEYLCGNNLQNGDGIGSTPTRLLVQAGEKLVFPAGKGYDISTVGLSGRTLEMGFKVTPAAGDPAGYGGGAITLGKTTILRGILKLYGARIITVGAGTGLQVSPNFLGSGSELLDNYFEAFGNMGFGNASGEVALCLNNTWVGRGTSATVVLSQAFATVARGNKLYAISSGRCINTAGEVKARGLVFAGTPSISLLRLSGITGVLTDPVYQTRTVPLTDLMGQLFEYFSFLRPIYGGSPLLPVAGVSAELLDKNLVTIVDAVTDANGQISFGAVDPNTQNAVKVRTVGGGTVVVATREDPFTFRVNHKSPLNPAFLPFEETFKWPGDIWIADGFSEQLYPIRAPVILKSPPATVDLPYFQDPDVAAMFLLEGQDVTVGGVVTKGILRRFTAAVLSGQWNVPILGTGVVVTVKTGSLPALVIGASLGTDGHTYKVRETRQIGDGALTEILLAES